MCVLLELVKWVCFDIARVSSMCVRCLWGDVDLQLRCVEPMDGSLCFKCYERLPKCVCGFSGCEMFFVDMNEDGRELVASRFIRNLSKGTDKVTGSDKKGKRRKGAGKDTGTDSKDKGGKDTVTNNKGKRGKGTGKNLGKGTGKQAEEQNSGKISKT